MGWRYGPEIKPERWAGDITGDTDRRYGPVPHHAEYEPARVRALLAGW
jgi:hypothetical protein